MKTFLVAGLMLCIGIPVNAGGAMAQTEEQSPAAQAIGGNSAPGGAGVPGGSSGFGHRGGQGREPAATLPGEMPELQPTVEPRQRLDVGALLCQTEAQLAQHQAAIMARLAGKAALEPSGCHVVGITTAVAVLHRDGQARTEIQIAGANPRTGWTDSVVRDANPFDSPLH